jgi:hypothetical protein
MSASRGITVFGIRYRFDGADGTKTVWSSSSSCNIYIEKNRRGYVAFAYVEGRVNAVVSKLQSTPEGAVTDLTGNLVARERNAFEAKVAKLMKMVAPLHTKDGDS